MNCVVSFVDVKLKKNRFPRISMVAMLESIEAFYLEITDRFLETSIGSDARKEQDRNDSGVGC